MGIFSWFKKEDWRLVKVYTEAVKFGTAEGEVNIYLYESDMKNRKIEYCSSFPDASSNTVERYVKHTCGTYRKIIYPWLAGRYDPEISSYDNASLDDAAAVLPGKIED